MILKTLQCFADSNVKLHVPRSFKTRLKSDTTD